MNAELTWEQEQDLNDYYSWLAETQKPASHTTKDDTMKIYIIKQRLYGNKGAVTYKAYTATVLK